MTTEPNAEFVGGKRIVMLSLLWVSGAGLVAFSAWLATSLVAIFSGPLFPPAGPYRDVVKKPADDFTQLTGLVWPSRATVVSVGDSHGGFNGDGEFHLILDADRATLESWLEQPPPWEQAAWLQGPIPEQIESHCRWGLSNGASAEATSSDSPPGVAWERLADSADVRYVAREHCCESTEWYNGELLVIDLSSNRVWLSSWDF